MRPRGVRRCPLFRKSGARFVDAQRANWLPAGTAWSSKDADIGTVVLPDADVEDLLTARRRRRIIRQRNDQNIAAGLPDDYG